MRRGPACFDAVMRMPGLRRRHRTKARRMEQVGLRRPTSKMRRLSGGDTHFAALHEPPGEGTGPTGRRPSPLTRRTERFMVPMRAKKRKEALHEPDFLLSQAVLVDFEF